MRRKSNRCRIIPGLLSALDPGRYWRHNAPKDHMSPRESDGRQSPFESTTSVSGAMYLTRMSDISRKEPKRGGSHSMVPVWPVLCRFPSNISSLVPKSEIIAFGLVCQYSVGRGVGRILSHQFSLFPMQ